MMMLRHLVLCTCLGAAEALAQAETERVLTFREAIDRAASASPESAMAQAELDASVAQRKEAMSGLGPRLRADFTEARFDKAVEVPFGPDEITLRPDRLREGSLAVSQPISGLYTAYEQTAAAKAREKTSSLSLDVARADAAFAAAEAYLAAQQAEEMVAIARASLTATESQVKDAEALTRSGRLIRSDLLKIGIAVQDAKAQLARALSEQKKARNNLLYQVGLPAGDTVQLEKLPVSPSIQNLSQVERSGNLQQATQNRLEIKRAASQLASAEHAERLIRLKYMPQVDVFVKWERIYSEPPFGNPPFTRSYGVSASWDIWDNGARSFAHDAAAAETRKASTKLQESKDRLRLEIDGLLSDLEAAKESFAAARAAVDQAEEAYRLDKARFGSGLVTTTDLLLSEATSTKAKGNLISSVVYLDRLLLALQRASGSTKPEAVAL